MAPARLVLASSSPRRRALLDSLQIPCRVVPVPDDGPATAAAPGERVLQHARHKAGTVAAQLQEPAFVLAADTLVFLDGAALTKPADRAAAERMLRALSGRIHEVWTGAVLLAPDGRRFERADCARVRFDAIPEFDLQVYLDGHEWRDKAGAYGLQGWAGRHARLESGDPGTVVGLAAAAVLDLLAQAGMPR